MNESKRRRTFAIISHPDAGKTTLTEKLLLYGGALNLAGSVTARKQERATTSDWMEIERRRGISISSTVLQFEYRNHFVNLLDTPGHRDFSEDTYRVLTAVDAAMMVIDAGKGIESQTRKLFEVCRRRGIPIFTFVNKLDRPARDPFALLDELENVLGIQSFAVTWPLGSGVDFRGVYDRRTKKVHVFDRAPRGARRASVEILDLADPRVGEVLASGAQTRLAEELALLDGAGSEFDRQAVLAGKLTPVFFGSAVNNFGVELLLDAFIDLAPPPGPRKAGERLVLPEDPDFSGFVFKIQANMDPRHRDRLVFLRVCSGRFQRDMNVVHTQTGERLRLGSTHRIFGRERETVDEAYPGDIVGIAGRAGLRIGDTLAEDASLAFDSIPTFAPECFAWLEYASPAQQKAFRKGVEQLLQEGVVQSFELDGTDPRRRLLGAVGPLQFEVVQARLQGEYGVDTHFESAPWTALRWLSPGQTVPAIIPLGARLGRDARGDGVILFSNEWTCRYFNEKNPGLRLSEAPPAAGPSTDKRLASMQRDS